MPLCLVCVAVLHLCSRGGGLQQSLLLPQTAGNNAGNIHRLLQVLALEVLLDPAQVVLVEYIVLLQETTILLVYFTQKVVEHQCGMWLLIGSISPVKESIIRIWYMVLAHSRAEWIEFSAPSSESDKILFFVTFTTRFFGAIMSTEQNAEFDKNRTKRKTLKKRRLNVFTTPEPNALKRTEWYLRSPLWEKVSVLTEAHHVGSCKFTKPALLH